jgi:hypothetical protein
MMAVELFKSAPLKGHKRLRLQEPGPYIETIIKRLKVQTRQLVSDLIDGFGNQLDALQASLETEHTEVVLNINTLILCRERRRTSGRLGINAKAARSSADLREAQR